jgi:hypothetical protein
MRLAWLLRSLVAPGTYKTARAGEGHQRTQPFSEGWPNSADVAKCLDRAESADGIAIRRDPFRERRADAWQRLNFLHRRSIEILRSARCAAVHPGPRCRGRGGRGGRRGCCRFGFVPCLAYRVHAQDLAVQRRRFSRGRLWNPGAPETNSASGQGDEGEKPESFALVGGRHELVVRWCPTTARIT